MILIYVVSIKLVSGNHEKETGKRITISSCLACRLPFNYEIDVNKISYEHMCHTNVAFLFSQKKNVFACRRFEADINTTGQEYNTTSQNMHLTDQKYKHFFIL